MRAGRFRFDRFSLDPQDRQLRRDDAPVALNARYLDALALLVREQGRLVTKDRFLEEVWRGVPVTDEALTQCIRTLRRLLGDDAARPRFIETAPKHGYRFVAPVAWEEMAAEASAPVRTPYPWREAWRLTGAGMAGGAMAGVLGGLVYGFAGVSEALAPGVGAVSTPLVLTCLTLAIGLVGSTAVAFGIAMARGRGLLTLAGGAAGGFVVGAAAKLVGTDAFNLLFGQSPGGMTGAPEGAMVGAAVGLGAWIGLRSGSVTRAVAAAAAAGAAGGALIPLLGGRLLGGSLEGLAERFPNSRLRLEAIGALFGESGFGPVSQAVTSALEAALFGACVAGALTLAQRRRASQHAQGLAVDNHSH